MSAALQHDQPTWTESNLISSLVRLYAEPTLLTKKDHSGEKECIWAWLGWIGGGQQRR